MPAKGFLLFFLFHLIVSTASAQAIRGEVLDMDSKQAIPKVIIENIYTALQISTDETGAFLIAATSGQLLEFKREGYKTVRVRIPQGYIPSYFRIIMKKGFTELKNLDIARDGYEGYKNDSLRFHELYKHELDFPKMSAFDMIQSPFTALSRKNQEIWRFQEDYKEFEKEKYVDKIFNESLVTKFTGLTGDSLHYYMRRYRPSYYQLRNMNEYTFYNFVRSSVYHYRNVSTPRNAQ
jgi:hypothetical protein